VPSAKPRHLLLRLTVAACAGSLLLGATAGCSTTQEKAKAHQEESERILKARAERQAQKKKDKKKGDKGNESPQNGGKKQ